MYNYAHSQVLGYLCIRAFKIWCVTKVSICQHMSMSSWGHYLQKLASHSAAILRCEIGFNQTFYFFLSHISATPSSSSSVVSIDLFVFHFCSFSYNGVYYNAFKLSTDDIIVSQKEVPMEKKVAFLWAGL